VARLDHVAFGVLDRAAASAAMACLGFTTAPSRCRWEIDGAPYSAAAASVVFAAEDLDLIEIADPRFAAHLARSPVHARGMAPTGVVLSGARPECPSYPITRELGGTPPVEIPYRYFTTGGRDLPFGAIADPAPEALRRREWTAHDNTALGIAEVHLRVPSVADARNALAGGVPGSLRIDAGPAEEAAAVVALAIRVASLEAAERALARGGVTFARGPARLDVAPEQGFGTAFAFVA
jgi:hypothetical protein